MCVNHGKLCFSNFCVLSLSACVVGAPFQCNTISGSSLPELPSVMPQPTQPHAHAAWFYSHDALNLSFLHNMLHFMRLLASTGDDKGNGPEGPCKFDKGLRSKFPGYRYKVGALQCLQFSVTGEGRVEWQTVLRLRLHPFSC